MYSLAIAIAVVCLTIALILYLHRWAGQPGREIVRVKMIEKLWTERECIRFMLERGEIDLDKAEFALHEINDALAMLGVPRESLQ